MESILQEAERITDGDRNADYGDPNIDFKRIAGMWSALKGVKFEPHEVADMMICVKLSRNRTRPKRDNYVDMAGYAKCGHRCIVADPEEQGDIDEHISMTRSDCRLRGPRFPTAQDEIIRSYVDVEEEDDGPVETQCPQCGSGPYPCDSAEVCNDCLIAADFAYDAARESR